jgi:hypothetical protein
MHGLGVGRGDFDVRDRADSPFVSAGTMAKSLGRERVWVGGRAAKGVRLVR